MPPDAIRSAPQAGRTVRMKHCESPWNRCARPTASMVLTGHDHIYERVKPQQGVVFIAIATDGRVVDAGQFARVETVSQSGTSPSGVVP